MRHAGDRLDFYHRLGRVERTDLGDGVVKVTIFVTDMGHFDDVVTLRREFFAAPYPADTIAEIRALYTPEAMIEIEAIACVSHQEGR